MIRVTIDEAQENFDFLLRLVERGENVLIEAPKGNVVMTQVAPGRNIGSDVDQLLQNYKLISFALYLSYTEQIYHQEKFEVNLNKNLL